MNHRHILRPSRIHTLLRVALGIGVLGLAGAAQAAVGARVLVQQWSPLTPDQQSVQQLSNDPAVVSNAVQKAWNDARPRLCQQLQAAMGRGGAAGGQTLRNITCLLDPAANFSVASAGTNALTVKLAISGYVEATSTTPTVLGSYADPRFSLALTGHLLMVLAVQPDPNQTLRFDKVQFTLSNALLDSHNFSGDVLKFVANTLVPFFGGPNYKQMAENAINSIGIDIAGRFNNAIGPINAALRAPSNLVRVGVWGKPEGIVVAFGPREIMPPGGGTLSGVMHPDGKLLVGTGTDCGSLTITAHVQTGPAPLLDPAGRTGDAPMRTVGSFSAQAGGAPGECHYRVSGLAAGWPNQLSITNCEKGHAKFALRGDGWAGRLVVPKPNATGNYFIETPLQCVQYSQMQAVPQTRVTPGDPSVRWGEANSLAVQNQSHTLVVNAAAPATLGQAALRGTANTSVLVSATPGATSGAVAAAPSALGQANRVALNPQPLPPRSAGTLHTAAPAFGNAPAEAAPALNWGAAPR